VSTAAPVRARRLQATMREESGVTPLELFFDLVFVLALTQCTALMADEPTWTGVAKGLLALGALWWAWVGYAWLTSVVNPEEGIVRIAIFVSMAGLLVAALCVPAAFDESALLFAGAYGVVRLAQLYLLWLAGADDAALRRSVVTGLLGSTLLGVALIAAAAFADGPLQGVLWALAIALDMAGPYLFGSEGWKLEPSHFAERHGLIVIIALGESIVAIGAGIETGLSPGVVVAAVVGIAIAATQWWLYFDVVALVAERKLSRASPGREQNEMARDSYSFLHLPMVAGIVLVALGLKKTLGDVGEPLELIPAVAVLGGSSIYLLAHVAFRWRNVHSLNRQRLGCAVLFVLVVPVALELPALATAGFIAVVLIVLVAYEAVRFSEARDRIRHQLEGESAMAAPAGD
jgi:low temperature requirement protein LtrA